ncbi:Sodium:solute symporter family [Popillia japonica]|uniref:Sodium:solute symporter family n=1 Tax=Popillia japonica TaxID=7064 RepID=A0AAW1KPP5_POPJA
MIKIKKIVFAVIGKEQHCSLLSRKFALEDLNTVVDTTHKQLIGSWLSTRCEIRSGPQYLLRSYTFREDGTYKLIQHHYWDSSCSLPKFTITSLGLLRLTRNLVYNPDAAIGFIRPVNMSLIPQGSDAAQELKKIIAENCPDYHWQQWKKYEEYLLHDAVFKNNEFLVEDSIINLACLGNLKRTFSELKFIKIEIRPIYSDVSENPIAKFHRVELILGDTISEDLSDTSHMSIGFQPPLLKWTKEHKILAHGKYYKIKNVCGICENLQRSDRTPPHLLKQPELPPYIQGSTDQNIFSRVTKTRPTSYSEPLMKCMGGSYFEDNWESIYFGFIKKQSTADDYLLGGKKMSVTPIAMSMISSIISSITLLGVPTDIYKYGVTYGCATITLLLAMVLSYLYCLPVFYALQVTSTYEYLEKRFDSSVRSIVSALFTLSMFLYLPIVIYLPALALSQATSFNVHGITPILCGVCVFYTTVGGLKAVVWTDAIQFIVMIATTAATLFLALSDAGGLSPILQRNSEYGRLTIDFSVDITKRDTIWTGTIGTFFMWFFYASCNQGLIQKCIALPNYKAVKNALISSTIGIMAFVSISTLFGLIIFAKFYDCDPLLGGKIKEPDQLLPYYIMDISRNIPGLPGLFAANIFSAALSTLSAHINCLSATIYEDFLSRFVKEGTSQETISKYLKLLSVIIGVINIVLVYFIQYMGSLLPLNMTFGGATSGTILGIFLSGLFLPTINTKGALWGSAFSFGCLSVIAFGSQYYKLIGLIKYPHLPVMTHGCKEYDSNFDNTTIADSKIQLSQNEPWSIFWISFYYYTVMGATITTMMLMFHLPTKV